MQSKQEEILTLNLQQLLQLPSATDLPNLHGILQCIAEGVGEGHVSRVPLLVLVQVVPAGVAAELCRQ